MPPMTANVTELLAALRERHGLDWGTAAAIGFERSLQRNVSLTQALTHLVAELERAAKARAENGQ